MSREELQCGKAEGSTRPCPHSYPAVLVMCAANMAVWSVSLYVRRDANNYHMN